MKISVIVSTFNRPEKVRTTINCFSNQTIPSSDFEIIVVDNGSREPVKLPVNLQQKNINLIRFEENRERSVSRSTGVNSATGDLVVFSDDDLIVEPNFLELHLKAHQEWGNLMAIGRIILPPDRLAEPGVRFRQELEFTGIPTVRGLVKEPNFGTAANMSINRELYISLGGFDADLAGIEDQDFAMRHSANGGNIAYLPEAVAIHDDDWLDFFSFCKRQERGMEWTVAFSRRYPNFQSSIARDRINGDLKLGGEPLTLSFKKIFKSCLGTKIGESFLSKTINMTETVMPESVFQQRLYGMALGVFIQRGYRRGIRNLARQQQ